MFLPFEACLLGASKELGGQAHDAAPVKRTLCKFWLEGQCSRGESCTWAHGVEVGRGWPGPQGHGGSEALGAMARRVLRLWKRRRLRVAQALLAAGRRAEAARALEEHLRAVAGRQGDESQLRVALARHLLCIARGETPQEISRDYVEALEKVYK